MGHLVPVAEDYVPTRLDGEVPTGQKGQHEGRDALERGKGEHDDAAGEIRGLRGPEGRLRQDVLERGLTHPVFTDEMKAVLNDAQEIICVGASSEEIPPGVTPEQGRAAEERRAARRAEQIAVWIRQAVSRPIPIRKLNIGHHAPTWQPGDTSDQRRVVIILVLDSDDNIDVDEALRTAMVRESARAPIFDTLLTRYSLAEGTRFVWVE